jgi:hypothetical protein
VASLFLAVLAVGPFLLVGQINSIPRGIGFLAAGLAFSVVLYQSIQLWRGVATRWYLVSVAVFVAILSLILWFFVPREGNTEALQRRLKADTDARVLLSFVGEDNARICKIFVNNTYFVGELSAIDCPLASLFFFNLALYDDIHTMNEDFSLAIDNIESVSSESVSSGSVSFGSIEDCKVNRPTQGEWQSKSSGGQHTAGRFLCYLDKDGDPTIVWTYNDRKISAFATGRGDMGALYDWWNKSWSIKS